MKKSVILLSAICFIIFPLLAQNKKNNRTETQAPLVLGVVNKIYSVELKETRTLNIYLPEGYSADSSAIYPVIYLLDGSANEDFIHITGIVQFLTMIETMPKTIIVGIANVDRRRDFTFPTTVEQDKKDYPTSGHSDKFMAFIEKELQPFIQKKYKTAKSKSIIGQSLGGLLATEILLKKPYLFDNYFIVSPSLWWDQESLLKQAPALLDKQADSKRYVYISAGSEGKQMEDDAQQIGDILQKQVKLYGQVQLMSLPGETHLTILHNCIYKCLESFYSKKSGQKE